MTEVLSTLTSLEWSSTNGALVAVATAPTEIYVANRLLTPEDKEAEKFKKLNKLPSPSGALPIVGHLFAAGMSSHNQFSEWSKTLGPIFSVKMGSSRTCVSCQRVCWLRRRDRSRIAGGWVVCLIIEIHFTPTRLSTTRLK
ncbi:hypothetical protein BC936DRAFT_146279 [Jimgerdemannia flammicorona]|uniref:Uncharacterized protein n=1 Tax=Jimgerdemannia flammicorona TaxID=994334 RepID=A0A433D7Z4_9FUNG|nr:hypothetical protein BC936DRAFT_146279 [Jimgerdemannia flammicorona]